MTGEPEPDEQPELAGYLDPIDARGLRCPLPVIRLAARAKELPSGTELVVLSTDPAARPDIAAWCRIRGHELVSQKPLGQDGVLEHRIRLG